MEDGKIARIVENDPAADQKQASNNRHSDLRIIDAAGKIVAPGLIGMHVHLRQPGQEHKETIETGCRAAGFQSPGRNTPFDGWQLTGKPVLTMVEGRIIFDDGRC